MSKTYTKVIGYCETGCAREVVTKEEFDDTKILVVDKNGNRYKELVFEIDEETGEANIKLVPAPTETPTE